MDCGKAPNEQTRFGNLPGMFVEVEKTRVVNMNTPYSVQYEPIEYTVKEEELKEPFWDDQDYIFTLPSWSIFLSPATYALLKLTDNDKFMPLWVTPPREQTMFINAEEVPNPITFPFQFDETLAALKKSGDPLGWGEVSKKIDGKIYECATEDKDLSCIANDWGYKYNQPLYKIYNKIDENRLVLRYYILDKTPAGFVDTPEANEQRQKNMAENIFGIENGWVIKPAQKQYPGIGSVNTKPDKFIYADWVTVTDVSAVSELNELQKYISSPSDHSTLPQNIEFVKNVMAYDLPIGFGESVDPGKPFKEELIKQADCTLTGSDPYFDLGILAQNAAIELLEKYFVGQTILTTNMPESIDTSHGSSVAGVVSSIKKANKIVIETKVDMMKRSSELLYKASDAVAGKAGEALDTVVDSAKRVGEFMSDVGDAEVKIFKKGVNAVGDLFNYITGTSKDENIDKQD